jgi:type IV pilus assembly protein PilB
MALNSTQKLSGVARRLVDDGLLDADAIMTAQQAATDEGTALVTYLVKHHIVEGAQLATVLSQEFGLPLFDLNAMDLDAIDSEQIPEKLVLQHHALPLFQRGTRLYVAVSDPMNIQALDAFQFHSGQKTFSILVDEAKLASTIDKVLDDQNEVLAGLMDTAIEYDISDSADTKVEDLSEKKDGDTPVVKFINGMLSRSIKNGASDIHFEPYETEYRVRARIDGVLQELSAAPIELAGRIAARLKVLSRLNIAERRVPQDGRMRMKLSATKSIDFRVSTCPTLFGEKIVLRILDATQAKLGIDSLGYEPEQKQVFLDIMHRPYGMILITGPTGSGKTVSLYTALGILNTDDRNISTAEDPAEITLAGINQVNMHPEIGLTFAASLRAFLRQDPDIIMVGEIRDLETAEIAIKAAQTGHLVLSTLHTNDAPQTLTRLSNMGVAPFNIASAVSLIIAQRLARKLCSSCKTEDEIPNNILLEEGFTQAQVDNDEITIYKAVGCDKCTGGYKGRTGIYQVMPISEEMRSIILIGGSSKELELQAAEEGVLNLRESGINKVAAGIFSIEELNRITKE